VAHRSPSNRRSVQNGALGGQTAAMHWVLLPLGVLLLASVMWDALVTTLSVATHAGPVSGRVAHQLWKLGRHRDNESFLESLGVVLTLVVLGMWLVGLWAGWSLIFNASPTAVLDATSGAPAGGWDRIYYAGSTMFTLGPGDFRPNGAGWQLASVVALLNGLGLASLGITYLLPVTAAATERRQLAATISALGDRPDDMLLQAWDGSSFGFLPHHLIALGPEMDLLSQRHLAYPVLHFFHSTGVTNAAAPMIARLDEMVTMARLGLREQAAIPPSAIEPLHAALTHFLDTLRSAYINPAEQTPPPPPLDRLHDAGIPVVDDATFSTRVATLRERRRLLLGMVTNEGWSWEDVWPSPSTRTQDPAREEPDLDPEEH
jgi:hypothetical protein